MIRLFRWKYLCKLKCAHLKTVYAFANLVVCICKTCTHTVMCVYFELDLSSYTIASIKSVFFTLPAGGHNNMAEKYMFVNANTVVELNIPHNKL